MKISGREDCNKRNMALRVIIAVVLFILPYLIPARNVMAYDNVVVVIDPGHGGPGVINESDLGAVYGDVIEKDVDLITAQALYDELTQYGNVSVFMTRTDDTEMTLKDRAEFAGSVGADILISVHYNASEFHRFYGTEIFTSAFDDYYARGYSMASSIMSWWTEAGGVSKGIKVRIGSKGTDYYGLIREARSLGIPAIILEHGYLDNSVDADRLPDAESWKRMGILDATAIADYYGLKKNMVQADIEKPITVEVPTSRVEPDITPPENVHFTIDSYDNKTGVLSYTIYADEPESMLMYYDLDTEELASDLEKGFMHLNTWKNGEDHMQGTFKVPDGYNGSFVARAYNNYELFTDSAPESIPVEMLITDAQSAKAYLEGEEETSDIELTIQVGDDINNENETADEGISVWNIDDVLKGGEESDFSPDYDDMKKQSRSNYIGMIVAIVVVGLMFIASVVLAILTMTRKNNKKAGNENGRK